MSGFSWVTLATNDSYSLGALVLAHSLKRVGTAHQLVVMVTPGVTQPMREKLRSVFDLMFEVNILDSKDERNLLLLQRPELGITFTKLHCWRLTQYNKCVFLDADTLVLQNCDELFDRDEFSAAPDVGWPDCFNSGVFVYKPSDETFNSLLAFALQKGSFDGGDQGLLNLYFSDWAHKDISKHLPFIYNMCSTACYSYLPAFKQFGENVKIVHFIGNSKPWLQYFNSETLHVSCNPGFEHLQVVFEHWWNLFCSHVHSGLQPTMARINTPIASSYTSSSHTPVYCINESKSEDNFCSEQFCGTDLNNIPIWDPWENYQPVASSLEIKSIDETLFFVDNLNNEPSSSSYYVENIVENKIVSNFDKSCNDVLSNDVNIEFSDCKSHINKDSVQDEHVSITNDPPPNSCIYSQPQPPDPSLPSAYESVTSTVVYDAKSASTVTITTEQPATNASKTETRTDSNGGLAGAFAQMTLREPRSADQGALEEHLRRQGWEAGRIDYLGQDSFENVWKKICETMSTAPKKEPSPPKQIPSPAEPVAAAAPAPVAASSLPLVPEATAALTPVAAPTPASVAEPTTAPAPSAEPSLAPAPAPVTEPAIATVPSAEPAILPALSPVTQSAIEPAPAATIVEPAAAPSLSVETAAAPGVSAEVAVVQASVAEPTQAPVVEPAAVPAPVTEAATAAAPAVELVSAPTPAPESVTASVPVPESAAVPTPAPESAPAPVTAATLESVAASVPAPESVTEPVPVAAVESVAAPASVVSTAAAPTPESAPVAPLTPETVPAPVVKTAAVSTPEPAPVAPLTPETVPASVVTTAAASTPEPAPVAPLTPETVPAPVESDTASVSVVAPTPGAVATPIPIPEQATLSAAVAASESAASALASAPEVASVPVPIAEPVAATTEAPKVETVAVSAVTPIAELTPEAPTKISGATQGAEPTAAEPSTQAPVTKTEKKEAAKPKSEIAEGQSSESTPVPPPRKSGKSGGATAKKSSKKK